jgi:hypothetical protein
MVFYADSSAFKKVDKGSQRFLAVTGTGADYFHEVPKRVVLAIYFAIRIFHGFKGETGEKCIMFKNVCNPLAGNNLRF